jgi:hypothetical protein
MVVLVVCGALSGACINREVSEVQPRQSKEQVLNVPVNLKSDIDILFVIDNSGSMRQEQASLVANFGRFINVLSTIEGLGLPNVHIGVVSTNMGTGPFPISGCAGGGDNGVLQNAPRQTGCSPPAGQFISDLSDGAGGRVTNYTGDLADTFSCIAELGISGCGFEQPLQAMRRALDGSNTQNAGFLRPDALLGIVFITDEDDCSTENTQMFDTSQDSIDDPLGELGGHRCFEFGVACDPDTPRQTGVKDGCVPRENSEYMYGVQEYIDFVRDLKPDERDIVVAGIIGPPTPVIVGTNDDGRLEVEPTCEASGGVAAPAVRLQAFLDGFVQTSSSTICNNDLSDALTLIAELMARAAGNPCLDGNIAQPLQCEVSEVLDFQETQIPRCDDDVGEAADNQPCHLIFEDPMWCGGYPSQLAVKVYPEERTVPTGTRLIVRCLAV